MRLLDENNNEISESDCDLSIGYIQQEIVVRADATPIDDETKFAWSDDDYETIRRYIVVPEEVRTSERVAELKRKLMETDYAIIKIAEGAATPEEYADVIAQRQAWRAEINQLEGDGATDG